MIRIIKNKLIRNRTAILYITIAFALVYYIHNIFTTRNLSIKTSKKSSELFYNDTESMNYVVGHTTLNYTVNTTLEMAPVENMSLSIIESNNYVNRSLKLEAIEEPHLIHKMGHVNVHVWYKTCIGNIDSLRQFPLFPLWPNIRGQPEMSNELVSIIEDMWSAQRIMGLLYPPVSGDYRFEISSVTISEFWLSTSEDPEKAVLLARNSNNFVLGIGSDMGRNIPKSKAVLLDHGKVYYFEIIHGMNDLHIQQVQVRWMLPGAKKFTAIPNSSLSTFITNDNSLDMKTRRLIQRSPSLRLHESTRRKPKSTHEWADSKFGKAFHAYPSASYTRENLHTLKFANSRKIMTGLKDCNDYAPSYIVKRTVARFESEVLTHFTEVFPDDDTDNKIWHGYNSHLDRQGNILMEEFVVIDIVKNFMTQLEDKFPGEYLLANVVNVERNVDVKRGNRFFLELVLLEIKTKELQRLSEYVYQFKDSSSICKPKGFKWSPTVKINAIVTAKKQGPWVVHYIKSMAQVLHATHEHNVHFVIVDFGNDVEIEEELRRSEIENYTLIKKTGKFHKTLAIDAATKSIKDDNSIVFLTDLHLDVPNNIFESVRKHTIRGIMAYSPVVFRLAHCGRPDREQTTSSGYWESYGYGVFSSYKSDWKYFGGVNVKDFNYKWGGEDSEMADRVLSKGFEIERLRLPDFYHYYHDKKGMWDQA